MIIARLTLQIIRVDAKENVRKQILRELQVGHDCNSSSIVTFYGAFQNEARDIVLCMEYMDCGYLLLLLLQLFVPRHPTHPRTAPWIASPKTSVPSVSTS